MVNQWRKRKKRVNSIEYFRFRSSRGRVSGQVTRKGRKYVFLRRLSRDTSYWKTLQSLTKPEAFLGKKRHIAVITKTGSISRKKKLWHVRRIKVRNKAKQRCLFLIDLVMQLNVCTSKQKLKKQILFSSGNDYHYKKISYILEGQETKE